MTSKRPIAYDELRTLAALTISRWATGDYLEKEIIRSEADMALMAYEELSDTILARLEEIVAREMLGAHLKK